MEQTAVIETAQVTTAAARILCAVKENRIELIGVMILAHLLGLSDNKYGKTFKKDGKLVRYRYTDGKKSTKKLVAVNKKKKNTRRKK